MRTRNNKIINQIMTSPSQVVMLMTKSKGETIGFLSELSNFYKHTYWMSAAYDNMHSFDMAFALKVFGYRSEEFNKLIQYRHCHQSNRNIIVNETLLKIASLNEDCLLVADDLELLDKNFRYALLEILLKTCPRNLKVVLISNFFLDINYNIFSEHCPTLLDYNSEDEDIKLADSLKTEELTSEQVDFLHYISSLHFAERGFVASLYPAGVELMDYLGKGYQSFIRIQDGVYCIDSGFQGIVERSFELPDESIFTQNIKNLLCEYYILQKKYIEALDIAVAKKRLDLVDKIVRVIMDEDGGENDFLLFDFVEEADRERLFTEDIPKEYIGARYLNAYSYYIDGQYDLAKALAERLLKDCREFSPLYYYTHHIIYSIYFKQGQYRKAAEYDFNLINNYAVNNNSAQPFYSVLHMFTSLPEAAKRSGYNMDMRDILQVEKDFWASDCTDKFWCAAIKQVAAEMCFDRGNYGKAIRYIDDIKQSIPFYVIPYNLMDYYYYIGDMQYAMEIGKKALADAETHSLRTDISDVYVLLAKASMYLNRFNDAIGYIDDAINCLETRDAGKYYAAMVRSIIYAKTGKAEYGRDIAKIYAKYCEYNGLSAHELYGALAYCCWRLHDYEHALNYAGLCIKKSNARSGIWMLSSAISVSILLERGEFRDAKTMVDKVLTASANYGMITILLDYYDCFENILYYAREHGLQPEYLAEIELKHTEKADAEPKDRGVNVRLLGNTSVTVGGTEIQWKTKKAKELFLLYVWQGTQAGLDRNYLLNALWDDYVYVSAINNLKTTNNTIRNTLNDAQVNYKLVYTNGRYALNIADIRCDYFDFIKKLDGYDENGNISRRVSTINQILTDYNGGFALEVPNSTFRAHDTALKKRIILTVLKLINDLIISDGIIEAKRLIVACGNLDRGGEYAAMLKESEDKINKYYNEVKG